MAEAKAGGTWELVLVASGLQSARAEQTFPMVESSLQMAERHVAQAEVAVTRQEMLVERLRRQRHDTSNAEAVLKMLREMLALMWASLERIRASAPRL